MTRRAIVLGLALAAYYHLRACISDRSWRWVRLRD